MKTLLTLSLVLALGACSGVDADWPMEDAGPTANTSQPAPDAGPPPDNGEPPTCDYTNPNVDCDGDGRIGPADCDPYNDDSYSGAPELCSDSVDNNCDGQVNEGCTTTPPPTGGGSQCVDADKDGYCTLTGQPDCNDQDPTVKPGATEVCGNGKDDDCNSATSDTCGTTPPPSAGTVKVSVTYAASKPRHLRADVVYDTAFMGPYWEPPDVAFTTTGIKEMQVLAGETPKGVLVNTSEDNGAVWLCYGHDSTASLDPLATTLVEYAGKSWSRTQCTTYSPPGDYTKGCAMWCPF